MGMSGLKIKELSIGLFQSETDRDRQRKVGASQISDPCTRHLAMAIIGEKQGPSKYWLGGKIGTAVHGLLEDSIEKSRGVPEFADAVVEQKITLGELPEYGVISSKPDLVLPAQKHLVDWKTSTRAKTKKIQKWIDGESTDSRTNYTMQKYIGQTQLYAWGCAQGGTEIETISLVFINRDGTNEVDVVEYTYEYDEQIALALWNRLVAIWDELKEGTHPQSYSGNADCFNCSMNGLS